MMDGHSNRRTRRHQSTWTTEHAPQPFGNQLPSPPWLKSAFHFGGNGGSLRSGSSGRCGLRPGRHAGGGGLAHLGLHDINASLEVSAILDDDARRLDIADKPGILADFELIAGIDI